MPISIVKSHGKFQSKMQYFIQKVKKLIYSKIGHFIRKISIIEKSSNSIKKLKGKFHAKMQYFIQKVKKSIYNET